MTRVLLDALNPLGIPVPQVDGVLIAAYKGHASNPNSFNQACERFPGHQVVSIASHNAVDAQILDVENGAVDPGDYTTINDWCDRQVTRGVMPTIYCNTSTWPSVLPHLRHAVNWWAANWSHGPNIPPGSIGVQYAGQPGYDISIINDYIEGIDPPMTQPFTADQLKQIHDQVVLAINDAILPSIQEMYIGKGAPAGRATIASIGADVAKLENAAGIPGGTLNVTGQLNLGQ